MRRAVAGGVKNWPTMRHRHGSSVTLNCCLAISAFVKGLASRIFSVTPITVWSCSPLSAANAATESRYECSDSTRTVAYLKSYLTFNVTAGGARQNIQSPQTSLSCCPPSWRPPAARYSLYSRSEATNPEAQARGRVQRVVGARSRWRSGEIGRC